MNKSIDSNNGLQRVAIEGVVPQVNHGRFAAKRTLGDTVIVEADVFADGHDALSCVLLYREAAQSRWQETPMEALANDRWRGVFMAARLGLYRYTIQGWIDPFKPGAEL